MDIPVGAFRPAQRLKKALIASASTKLRQRFNETVAQFAPNHVPLFLYRWSFWCPWLLDQLGGSRGMGRGGGGGFAFGCPNGTRLAFCAVPTAGGARWRVTLARASLIQAPASSVCITRGAARAVPSWSCVTT